MKKLFVIMFSAFLLCACASALYAEKITFSAGSMTGQAGDSSATTTLTILPKHGLPQIIGISQVGLAPQATILPPIMPLVFRYCRRVFTIIIPLRHIHPLEVSQCYGAPL